MISPALVVSDIAGVFLLDEVDTARISTLAPATGTYLVFLGFPSRPPIERLQQ